VDDPTPVPGVDPSRVNTPADLAACLDALRQRRGLSYEAMVTAAKRLQARQGGSSWAPLTRSTIGEMVTGTRLPTEEKLRSFLAVCHVSAADVPLWLAAWQRAKTTDLAKPVGEVRVRDARPRELGVHDAIQVDGATGELPIYVPRDIDAGLRAALTPGAERGCFVLLMGGSSVGKTRTLYEAVAATLPQWWLVHPDDADAIRTLATAPTARTVLWLDELQRYFGADGGLNAGTVRALLRAGTVIVATMWPDEYGARIVPRQPGRHDQHAHDRELLELAEVFEVSPAFSGAEQARAYERAAADGRIRTALSSTDAGLTQVLAAGPELVRWWEQAPNPYARAVITAAVDARRLGFAAPLTREMLDTAARGYLTRAERATAPRDWLDTNLAYATTPLHGAAATLTPVAPDLAMGEVDGYAAADYLAEKAGD
jgi:Helix-turn-helix domain